MCDVAEFARKEPYLLSAFASTNALGTETRAQGRCKDPFQAGPYRRKPPGYARQPGSPPSSSQSELSALCRREVASAPRPPARPVTGRGGRRARDPFCHLRVGDVGLAQVLRRRDVHGGACPSGRWPLFGARWLKTARMSPEPTPPLITA